MNLFQLTILGTSLGFALTPRVNEPAKPAATYPVTITVTNLKSTTAKISLGFYNTKKSYPLFGKHVFNRLVMPNGKNALTVPVELASGEWAVAVYQDLNGNGIINLNMFGIPKGPVAFANNVRPKFKALGFDDCKFTVKGPGQTYTIAML